MEKINTLDELFAYASDILEGRKIYQPINLAASSYTFSVRITGDTWDKRIDVRHARYIQSLQATLNDIYDDYASGEEKAYSAPLVKAELKEGSSDIQAELVDILRGIVTPMTDTQTFITVMTVIACTVGYCAWSKSVDLKREQLKNKDAQDTLQAHEETKRLMLKPLVTNADNNPILSVHAEKPVKTLIHDMEEDDSVAFGDVHSISQAEAKKSLTRTPRSKSYTTYADGSYLLDKIDYSAGKLVLYLRQGAISVRVYTEEISTEDSDALFQEVIQRQKNEELPFEIAVQMNIHHTAKVISYGAIVGFGEPRKDKTHKALREIIQD